MNRRLPTVAAVVTVATLILFAVRHFNGGVTPATVLEVGQFQFTKTDLEQRLKVLQFYFPNEKNLDPKRDLIRVYSTAQVLLDHGIPDFRDRVIQEDKRIDNSTLDPTGLARIKRIFAGDLEAYRRIYIVPVLVPRLFSDFAGRHSIPQAKSRAKIEGFLERATKQPAKFAAMADEEKLTRRKLLVSEEKGVRLAETKANPAVDVSPGANDVPGVLLQKWNADVKVSEQKQAETWVRRYAPALKPGEVSPGRVDHGNSWLGIKFLGADRKTKELIFDSVVVPKDDTGPWQAEQEAKVAVKDHTAK